MKNSHIAPILSLLLLFCRDVIGVPIETSSVNRPRGVLILAIDTLRADRVGCYGRAPSITPNIDRLAAGAIVFESHYAPASWSLPCYSSLFTGALPSRHGVLDQNQRLPDRLYTLAEVLGVYGYRAAGFVGGSHLTGVFNLKQGFEVWEDEPNFGSFYHSVPRALAWLDELAADEPFLLMVHGYDCHTPYFVPNALGEIFDPAYGGPVHDLDLLDFTRLHQIRDGRYYPERKVPVSADPRRLPIEGRAIELDARDIDHIRSHYDAAVWYVDLWIGILLDGLRERGLYDDTLIVLIGDHGEDLMEHGFFFHRNALYRHNIHTPLILKPPRGRWAGRRVASAVSTVDVMPTLLGLVDAEAPVDQIDGRDLRGWLDGEEPPVTQPIFSVLADQQSIIASEGPDNRAATTQRSSFTISMTIRTKLTISPILSHLLPPTWLVSSTVGWPLSPSLRKRSRSISMRGSKELYARVVTGTLTPERGARLPAA